MPNEQPTTTPAAPAAPAQPAAAAPAQAPAASATPPNVLAAGDMSKLVPVTVNGQTRYEPVARVLEAYTERPKLQAQLAQANQHTAYVERRRALLESDPEGYRAETEREIARAHGRQPAKGAARAQQPNSQPEAEAEEVETPQGDPALRRELAQVRQELAEVRSALQPIGAERTEKAIDSALNGYELYRNAPGARARAATVVAALRVMNPQAPLEDLASQAHALDVQAATQDATQQRNERENNARTTQVMPTSNGMPALATPPPKSLSSKGFADGSFVQEAKAAAAQFFGNVRRATQ